MVGHMQEEVERIKIYFSTISTLSQLPRAMFFQQKHQDLNMCLKYEAF